MLFLILSLFAAKVDWIGPFLDPGSLAQTNREFVDSLVTLGEDVVRVHNGDAKQPGYKDLKVAFAPSKDAQITVRHAWPPNWKRPKTGKLVVIQPWEMGELPKEWLENAKHVDEFWCASDYVRDIFVRGGVPKEKVFAFHSGIDPKKFHLGIKPMKLATTKNFKLLYVGGTIYRKGADLMLQAYLNAFKASDDVCLVIKDFGGKTFYRGQTMGETIRKIQQDKNAPEILYMDNDLSYSEMPSLYAACNCLVHPYRGEGFCLPICEALGCGIGVVTTIGGAADEFAKDFYYGVKAEKRNTGPKAGDLELVQDGWMLECDIPDLARKMRYAYEHPTETRERGERGSAFVTKYYSWDHSAAMMQERIKILSQ